MDWAERLLDLALGGVAWGLDTDLAHLKKSAQARLGEHNPLRNISANHDLLRAVRLAWVRAAMDVLDEVLAQARQPEWQAGQAEVRRFDGVARQALRAVRDVAFNRNADPGASPIDAALHGVLDGVSDVVGSGSSAEAGRLGREFLATLGDLSGWRADEIPALVGQVAREGIALPGHRGAEGTRRTFGDLVFAEFADLIKDPERYPEAGAAFGIAMNRALRDLGQQTVDLLRGLDRRLDDALVRVDGLQALRDGLAAGQAAIRADLAAVPAATVDALMRRLQDEGALSGVERRTLIALAQRLTRDEVRDIDRAVKELEHAVELATTVMAHGAQPSAEGDFVGGVLARVAEHTRVGALDRGGEAVDDALAELERQEARQREALAQSRRALIEAGVRQDLLRRDAFAAARRLESLAALDGASPPAAAPSYLARARAYYEEGRDKGINLSLQVAIEMAQRMLTASEAAHGRRAVQILLADALACLGDRETDPRHLVQAVALRREILAGLARADDGAAWGAAQGALGAALNLLGWREYDRAMLEESIAAQRAELDQCRLDGDRLGEARALGHFGRALYALGFREGDADRVREAVRAFDAALVVVTRASDPQQWSRLQSLKGIALGILGRLDGQVATTRLAVEAHQEALRERSRERSPLDWSRGMSNLGLEWMALGRKTGDIDALDQAVAALTAATQARPREQQPLQWAMAQHNLGGALFIRASIAGADEDRLTAAVQALRAALGEFDRERTPVYWTASQTDLATTLTMLGRLRRSSAMLQEAVAAATAALTLRDRAAAPMEWANSQLSLAQALHAMADVCDDAIAAQRAVEAYRNALAEFTAERRPEERAEALAGLEALQGRPAA